MNYMNYTKDMNYTKALNLLELDVVKANHVLLTRFSLNKTYRKLALKYHPDKNGHTPESNTHFALIHEAYEYLKEMMEEEEEEEEDEEVNNYIHMLSQFIVSMMGPSFSTSSISLSSLSKIITNMLIHSSIQVFDELNKDVALNIYVFLSKYKDTLHCSNDLLDKIKNVVLQKYQDVIIYKFHPSIHEMLNLHFYKLYVQDILYLVPLWHSESYFDGSGCEIIALCEPTLPSNMKIDDNDNLIVELNVSFQELGCALLSQQPNPTYSFFIGSDEFSIELNTLYIKKEQYVLFKGKGLVRVQKDIYDVSNKADILVKLIIV